MCADCAQQEMRALTIRETFDIDYDDLADYMVTSYETYSFSPSNIKKKKLVRLGCINGKGDEKVLENRFIATEDRTTRPLTIDDLAGKRIQLCIRRQWMVKRLVRKVKSMAISIQVH